MLTRDIQRLPEREIKAVLFYGSYAVYFAGTLKILCTVLLSGINVLCDHLKNMNQVILTKMSKHRFVHFTGEETKLCNTSLLVQGLVKGRKYEVQPAGLSLPCVMVTPV